MKKIPSQLPIFIEVAKTLNFSQAAKQLGISTPAVSKAITKLEESLAVKLFHRSSHSLSLTAIGVQFHEKIMPMLVDIDGAISSIQQLNDEPSGAIKVNLPNTALATDILLPHIISFSEKYQKVTIDLRLNDQDVDLISNGFDIGIGTSINQDSRLIAKKLFASRVGLYASPNYQQKHGLPRSPLELEQHNCIPIRSISSGKIRSMPLYDGNEELAITPKGTITVDSFSAAKELLLNGVGIACLADWTIRNEMLSGEVVPVLKEYWGQQVSVYLYFSSLKYMPSSTRLFIEHMSRADFKL